MHTMTGTDSSSARRKAWMCRSAASWIVSAKSWTQPASRAAMASLWSFQMLIGRADGAVGQRHDDGQPEPAGVVDGLHHEEEPLAGRGGEGTGPGGRGADGHRHGGELRLHVDELARRELARLHHLAERLDDVGLRRDGVGAHDLRPAQRHRLRDGPRALNLPEHRASPFRWRS